MFIGILFYYTYKQMVDFRKWNEFLAWLAEKKTSQTVIEPVDQGDSDEEELPPVVLFNQYREPLLSSHAED